MKKSAGLIDRIRRAKTPAEIDILLRKGQSYATANDKTKRRWKRIADQRREEVS